MAWRRPGDKPLSEPMMVNLLTHTVAYYVTRPKWVDLCQYEMISTCRELTNVSTYTYVAHEFYTPEFII